MQARDLMTTEVTVVPPDMPARKIAMVLLDGGISAVPVVDATGAPIGMVSEGDLLGRREDVRGQRREWWLTMLAEGESLSPEFLAHLRSMEFTAKDLMSAPVVTVSESTEAAEIADLLSTYRIKRVPVVRDGKIVGIVSRADLVRGQSGRPRPPKPPLPAPGAGPERSRIAHAAGAPAAEERSRRMQELIDHHVGSSNWQTLLHGARAAAARVLDCPGVLAGDIRLFLAWGQ